MDNNLLIYVISFLSFIFVLALVEGLHLMWGSLNVERKVKVRRRLRHLSAAGVSDQVAISLLREPKLSESALVNRLMLSVPRFHLMDRMLEQAGLEITVSRYLLIQVIIAASLLVALLTFTPGNFLLVLVVAVAAGLGMPLLYVRKKREERMGKFTQLLPDTMDYIARSMRAGNPLGASLRSAAEEMPEPIASEFRTTFDEINFGLDMEEALHNLTERTGSEELRYFVTAVLIQRTTGGNLAEVLARIATVMRSRAATVREIMVLATEMKYSAQVLIAMPIFLGLTLYIVNPAYMASLTESAMGWQIIFAQMVLMGIGYYIIQKMINFRV